MRPTLGRKTLVIAYRYLNGGSFSVDQQNELVAALKGTAPEADGAPAVKAWINGRKEVLAEEKNSPEIYPEREYQYYAFFPNCAKNAFEVALETLKERAASYGANDRNVRAWLAAQDTVFQNCDGGPMIPTGLGPESPTWLRKDRDYQIAAAYFYSLNFDEARLRFERIAADGDSPWQGIAAYLAARTLIRQASLTRDQNKKREVYEQAENRLLILSMGGGQFAGASKRLLGLVKYNLRPEERVLELSRMLANGYYENLRQDLIDYHWLLDKLEARILMEEAERRKKLNPFEAGYRQTFQAKEAQERRERIERGELIEIMLFQTSGKTAYLKSFKPDVSEREMLDAFVAETGRLLTEAEIEQIKGLHKSALAYRQSRLSPNRKWDRQYLSSYEGCNYGCDKLTLDLVPELFRQDDLIDWIFTFQSQDPRAYKHALSRWRETDSLAWLITSLTKAERSSPGLDEITRAASKIGRYEPAFPTVAYHYIRLKKLSGKTDEARKLLDEIISWQSGVLPVSARNLFLEQRAELSRDLEEFLKSAQRRPVAFYSGGSLGKIRDLLEREKSDWSAEYSEQTREEYEREVEERYKDLLPWDERVSFDAKTVEVFNRHFPLQLWIEAARNPDLPDYLQRKFILAAWTRAVVLENDDVARRIAPEVLRLAPEISSVFVAYLKARTAKERRDEALYVLLKSTNLSPFLNEELKDESEYPYSEESDFFLENTWWCPLPELDYDDQGNEFVKPVAKPAFLTAAQLEAARRERQLLNALGDPKSYLGKRVLEWAKASPSEPRIPEVLFIAALANKGYKYGCNSWDSDEVTRQEAETLLRERYPYSPWTAKLREREN